VFFLQHRVGVDEGPIHLVNAGLTDQLTELGWNVQFDGHHQFEEISAASDPPIGKLRNPRLVSKVTEAVAKTVGGYAKKGQFPVTLGGDHSLVNIIRLALCNANFVTGIGNHIWNLEVPDFA
jgi:arginase